MTTQPKQDLHGIAKLFVEKKLLDPQSAITYQHKANQTNQRFLSLVINEEHLCPAKIARLIAEDSGLPFYELDSITNITHFAKLLPENIIRNHRILPLFTKNNQLFLAIDDPYHYSIFLNISYHTRLEPQPMIVETTKLTQAIQQLFDDKNKRFLSEQSKDYYTLEKVNSETLNTDSSQLSEDAPVIKLVNEIFINAIHQQASDIHFEPYENDFRIRFRLDGMLVKMPSPPFELSNRICSRIKIMANLDISERRLPQDGRIRMDYLSQKTVDLRVSTCPTIDGEKIVIRILDASANHLSVHSLGFNEHQKTQFLDAIGKPQGMVLVTGPTGSGKTQTLYTALNLLNTTEKNISSAEDPVEIKLEGINQVNINPKIGLTFASTLRSFLRQDPDIIMVGEIRDNETAEIAVKAAQTGHLLLSTLHTNSAAETLTRLLNLGLSTFNLTSSLSLLIAQRLVRKLCSHCRILSTQDGSYKAKGCPHCTNGYRGRTGLFEVMPISESLKRMILSGDNTLEILIQAKKEGMLTLYQSGLEKIKNGITTFEEVNRIAID